MNTNNAKNEVIIKLVGKLTLEFPTIDQLKVRRIAEEVMYKYDITSTETALVTSDAPQKIQLYLACKKLDGLSVKTLKGYKQDLEIFSRYIRKPLSNVNTMDLRMFLAVRCEKLKATSTNTQISHLKSFFGWLFGEEYIPKNPTSQLKQTKVPKILRHPLSDEEVENLRQVCIKDRDKALIEFLVSSGARLSEAISIDIDDIDFHEMSLFVVGKGSKERKIYFTVKAKILLKRYIKNRKGINKALFIAEKFPFQRIGDRAIESSIKKVAKAANFDKSVFPHLFRHSFATHSLNAGMSLPILQKIMGHSDPGTTMVYAELSDENVRHAVRRIS